MHICRGHCMQMRKLESQCEWAVSQETERERARERERERLSRIKIKNESEKQFNFRRIIRCESWIVAIYSGNTKHTFTKKFIFFLSLSFQSTIALCYFIILFKLNRSACSDCITIWLTCKHLIFWFPLALLSLLIFEW